MTEQAAEKTVVKLLKAASDMGDQDTASTKLEHPCAWCCRLESDAALHRQQADVAWPEAHATPRRVACDGTRKLIERMTSNRKLIERMTKTTSSAAISSSESQSPAPQRNRSAVGPDKQKTHINSAAR
jgi:hypothetical protein